MPIGDGHFCERSDPEFECLFSVLESGAYTRLRDSSPLLPPTMYVPSEAGGIVVA